MVLDELNSKFHKKFRNFNVGEQSFKQKVMGSSINTIYQGKIRETRNNGLMFTL